MEPTSGFISQLYLKQQQLLINALIAKKISTAYTEVGKNYFDGKLL
jgi:hypothetical protein